MRIHQPTIPLNQRERVIPTLIADDVNLAIRLMPALRATGLWHGFALDFIGPAINEHQPGVSSAAEIAALMRLAMLVMVSLSTVPLRHADRNADYRGEGQWRVDPTTAWAHIGSGPLDL
jgi:hypothetical protein